MSHRVNRREFLQASGTAAAVAPLALGRLTQAPAGGGNRAAANRVRLGVVGCGVRGLSLISRLPSLAGVELIAAADLYDGHLARAGEIAGERVIRTRDWRGVVERPDIDAVIVATPDHQHVRIALAAIQSGKDVYCEAPLPHRPGEAAGLLKAARSASRVLQGGAGWITQPPFAAARDVVASGQIGTVKVIRARWDTSSALDAWRTPLPPDASPQAIDYAAFASDGEPFDASKFFAWRRYRAYGSGLAGARFAPMLTAVHWLAGLSKPSRVAAMGAIVRWKDGREVPDTLHASLEYPEGCVIELAATQAGRRGKELRLIGTEAVLSIDHEGYWIEQEPSDEPYPELAESWPRSYRDWFYMMHGMTSQGLLRGVPAPEPSRRRFDVPAASGSGAAHLADFVDAVRTRREPKETADLANGAAEAAMLIDAAAAAGTRER